MKDKFKLIWSWLQSHLKTIVLLFGAVSTLFFTFVQPVLLKVVCLPVWAVLLLIVLPFFMAQVLKFYFKKANYQIGEIVRLRGNSMPYFVVGYGWLNKRIIKIRHYNHDAIFYHDTFLEKL